MYILKTDGKSNQFCCEECKEIPEELIEFQSREDGLATYICQDCLKKALAMFDKSQEVSPEIYEGLMKLQKEVDELKKLLEKDEEDPQLDLPEGCKVYSEIVTGHLFTYEIWETPEGLFEIWRRHEKGNTRFKRLTLLGETFYTEFMTAKRIVSDLVFGREFYNTTQTFTRPQKGD